MEFVILPAHAQVQVGEERADSHFDSPDSRGFPWDSVALGVDPHFTVVLKVCSFSNLIHFGLESVKPNDQAVVGPLSSFCH